MSNPVEECCGHLGIAKDLYLFGKVEISGDDQRGFFIEMADQVKEQSPA